MTLHPATSNQSFSRYLVALSRRRFGDDQPQVQPPDEKKGAVIAGCMRCPAELMAAGLDAAPGKGDHAAAAGPVKCLLVVGFYTDAAATDWQTAEASKFDAIYRLPER